MCHPSSRASLARLLLTTRLHFLLEGLFTLFAMTTHVIVMYVFPNALCFLLYNVHFSFVTTYHLRFKGQLRSALWRIAHLHSKKQLKKQPPLACA